MPVIMPTHELWIITDIGQLSTSYFVLYGLLCIVLLCTDIYTRCDDSYMTCGFTGNLIYISHAVILYASSVCIGICSYNFVSQRKSAGISWNQFRKPTQLGPHSWTHSGKYNHTKPHIKSKLLLKVYNNYSQYPTCKPIQV